MASLIRCTVILNTIIYMRLKEKYKKEIMPKMKEKFSYGNDMEVPKITKVVLNIGFGRHTKEKAYVAKVIEVLTKISGQKPILTKARLSISSFKIREGMTIGACVTLRQNRMYDFIEKLVNVTYPRVRDFRGLNDKSVDNTGNLTLGIKEYPAFPEINIEDADEVFGLEVSFATTAKTKEEGVELFRLFGFPFKKQDKKN